MTTSVEQDVRRAVGCPRCGSPSGRACRTPGGSSTAAHRERRDAWVRERVRREDEKCAAARAAEQVGAARRKAEAPKGRPTPKGGIRRKHRDRSARRRAADRQRERAGHRVADIYARARAAGKRMTAQHAAGIERAAKLRARNRRRS